MAFTIFNDANAAFPDQAEPDQFDFTILVGASGVLSGGAVTANGTNMTLAVAACNALVNGVPVTVTPGNVTIGAASANARWDLVVVPSTGVPTALAGTPSASNAGLPVFDPTLYAALSAVFIPTSTSALVTNNLVDKRKTIAPSHQRMNAATTDIFISSLVTGDTTKRLQVTADGKMAWTSGAGAAPTPTLAFDATLAGLLATGKFGATASAATEVPLTVTGAGSQSADLFQVRNNTPTVLVKVDSAGHLTSPNFQRGTGAPNSAVTGSIGDIYQQIDGAAGATLWIKESGNNTNTGWNASGTTSAGLILGGGQCPTGTLVEYGGGSLPNGWLWCDGSIISRATFSGLFAAIGTTWGPGDGSTTFQLPDKRGLVTAGSQNFGGNGTISDVTRQLGATIGSVAGERSHTILTGELPVHNHPVSDPTHAHAYTVPLDLQFVAGGANGPVGVKALTTPNQQTTVAQSTGVTVGNTGGGTAINVTQLTVLSRYIIKY
jgi:microcystin-dependent protein